jgi:hypothetical protein
MIRRIMDDQRPTPSSFLHFKGYNSITTFDEHRVVISGALSGSLSIYLIPDIDPCIKFKGNTTIVFDKNGNLKTGTLNEDYYSSFFYSDTSTNQSIHIFQDSQL